MPVAAELRVGKGSLVVSQLKATERVSYEPVAAAYYQALIDRAQGHRLARRQRQREVRNHANFLDGPET